LKVSIFFPQLKEKYDADMLLFNVCHLNQHFGWNNTHDN
jgi:hypothetical protein